MSLSISRFSAQAFNKAKSYVESFGEKKPENSYGQDLATDIYDLGERQVGLLDSERELKSLQRTATIGKYVATPAIAAAGLGLAVMAAPATLTIGAGVLALAALGASVVDGERANIKQEEIQAEKDTLNTQQQDISSRYETAGAQDKEDAFEAIQDVRNDRKDYATELREEAGELSWPASRTFNSYANSVEGMAPFFPQVETAPPAAERPVKWSAEGQRMADAMIWNTPY